MGGSETQLSDLFYFLKWEILDSEMGRHPAPKSEELHFKLDRELFYLFISKFTPPFSDLWLTFGNLTQDDGS